MIFLTRKDPVTRYVAGLRWEPQIKRVADTRLVITGPVLRGAVARNRSSLVLLSSIIAWRLAKEKLLRGDRSGKGVFSKAFSAAVVQLS